MPVEVPVTREVAVTVEVDATREVEVTRLVEATRKVEVTRNVEVTRVVPVTREVEATRIVDVTTEVEVTREVPVTRQVPVTRVVEAVREVPVTRVVEKVLEVEVPVTRTVQVTRVIETERPVPNDLCSDYPYMIKVVETERHYWKTLEVISSRTLSEGAPRLVKAEDDLAWIDARLAKMRANYQTVCNPMNSARESAEYEMKTHEGWSVCVMVKDRASSLILDEDWDVFWPSIKDSAWEMLDAYVDYCDNDFLDSSE